MARPLDYRFRQQVERSDEDLIEQSPLDAAVNFRLHGKALYHDAHGLEGAEQTAKLRDRIPAKDGRVEVIDFDLGYLVHDVHPRMTVHRHDDRLLAGFQHTLDLCQHPLGVRGEVQHGVAIDEIEVIVGKVELLAIHDMEIPSEPALLEVAFGELDRARSEVYTEGARTATREASSVIAHAAPYVEHGLPRVGVVVHEPRQIVQLLEAVVLDLAKECCASGLAARDLPIVDVLVPEGAHCFESSVVVLVHSADFSLALVCHANGAGLQYRSHRVQRVMSITVPTMGVDADGGEIANRVLAVVARVFELDERALSMSDSPQTIDRWDSLHHLKLITAVEVAFGIRLRMQSLLKIQDIAGLVAAVRSHQDG